MRARVPALILLLTTAAPFSAAAPSDTTAGAYNALQKPLRPSQAKLLSGARYQVKADGTVWAEGGTQALSEPQLQSVLQRLESSRRLQALLTLKILFSKSAGEKYLTPAEREEVRKIVRENWPYFTLGTRKDLRSYFSVKELEEMNRDPAPTDFGLSLDDMRDPEIDLSARYYEPPPELPKTGQAVPVSKALLAALPPPVLRPLGQPLQRPTLPTPAQPHAALPVASAPTVGSAPTPATQPAPSAPTLGSGPMSPTPSAPTAAAPAIVPAVVPSTPPATSTAPPVSVVAAPGAAAGLSPVPIPTQVLPIPTIQAPALPPPPLDISPAEFERFLAEAPYGRDAKALLKIIADKAPAFARARALESARSAMPHVVIDSARAGLDARGSLLVQETAAGERGYAVALSPGPAVVVRKRLFGKDVFLIADSPKVYGALHANPKLPDAARKDAVAVREESGEWGSAKIYADASLRGSYTQLQQAGTLLRKLLRLDARRRGWDANPYAAELYGRTAEMMLYARLAIENNGDAFLDPDLRVSLKLWLDHPHEWRDHLAHTLSAGRVEMLDPIKGGPEEQRTYNREALARCPASLDEEAARRAAGSAEALKKDILALEALALVGAAEAEQARKAVDAEAAARRRPPASTEECRAHYENEQAGLTLALSLLSEMNLAERKFREERGDGSR